MHWRDRLGRLAGMPVRAFRDWGFRRQLYRDYSRRSLAETFDHIYAHQMWGREDDATLFSGVGSRGICLERYCTLIAPEIQRRAIRRLVDIGCGDFNTGAQLARMVEDYTGVDVSERVIETNSRLHATSTRRFIRGDATTDQLPPGDAAVIRQVLQHLSNDEIARALANARATYRIVFVTEHIHAHAEVRPNQDIAHGPGTRVERRSGVMLDRAPFHLPATLIGDIPYVEDEVFRTWVIER